MKKTTDYVLLDSDTSAPPDVDEGQKPWFLQKAVQSLLTKGWELHGAPFGLSYGEGSGTVFQAMVLREG